MGASANSGNNVLKRPILLRHSPRKIFLTGLFLFLAAAAGVSISTVLRQRQHDAAGERTMTRLLAGDATIQLAGLDIEGQERSVHCTDRSVLAYVAESIRTHSRREHPRGLGYTAMFTFTNGSSFKTHMLRTLRGISLSMPADAVEETFPTHEVTLSEPVPPAVKSLLAFLDASDRLELKRLVLPTTSGAE
jgi:hypothetical protein